MANLNCDKIQFDNNVDVYGKSDEEIIQEFTAEMKKQGYSDESINHCINCNECCVCKYWSEECFRSNDDEETFEFYCYLPKEI